MPFGERSAQDRLDRASRDLLRAIMRAPMSNDDSDIARLAHDISDWDRFLAVAREHRLLPLVFSRLTEVEAAVPSDAMERLKSAYDRNVFHCMSNAAELITILKAFQLEQIPAMPFKGIALGATIYRDIAARNAGDLDILVDLEDLQRAAAILLKMGYELKTRVQEDGGPAESNSYEYHFERSADGMVVELRWRLELTQPRYRRDIGLQWVWPRRQTLKLAGAEISNMDPETTLLVLCMHGSKHVWSRLIWVCDLVYLLSQFPSLDWKHVMREARRVGLWRTLALGVLLANRICCSDVPRAVLQRLEADATASELARSLEEAIFDRPGELPSGRMPYSVRLLGFQDRIRLIFSPGFLRPNERDLSFIKLPKTFHPLYLLVRPLRMLRDKSAR